MSSAAAAAFADTAPSTPAAPAAAPAATPAAAAAPAPIPAGAASAPAANAAQWFDSFSNAEVKTWTQAKGFKDAAAVAESAYNLEKLIGHDRAGRTLVLPKDDASPEELRAFSAKLGVPEKPDGYKLPFPDGTDPKLQETISTWMHKAGVPPKAAEALTQEMLGFSQAEQARAEQEMVAASDKAFADVTTKWGKDSQANLEMGKRFTAQLIPAEVTLDNGTKVSRQDFLQRVFDSTGATGAMLELFANAGRGMGEHRMVTNGQGGMGDTSPAAALAKIQALKADQMWARAYLSGDKLKVAEMSALMAQAYPGSQ
jgi:hypothetical protein